MKNRPKKQKQGSNPLLLKAFFLALAIIALGTTLYFFKFTEKNPAVVYTAPVPSLPKATASPPSPEDFDVHQKPALVKIAIIIDDIGNKKKLAEDIIALDLNLSYSILPQSPYAIYLAEKITAAGRDMLLHLPLEPSDSKWNPGPGALMLSMSSKKLISTFNNDLTGFDFIGTNNHMGSKFTADPKAMHTLLSAVKSNGLFYVDSLTSAKSVGYTTAKELGIKTAKRDIFLDNEQTSQAIASQFTKLIAIAKRRGSAIGIGHPYPATLEFLTAFRPTLLKEVKLVGIHELVE